MIFYMKSILDYLTTKHTALIAELGENDGSSALCGVVAAEVAQRLLDEGKSPRIEDVSEWTYENGKLTHVKTLIPTIFKNKWTEKGGWGCHVVCCADNIAYDPLLGEPVPVNEYCKLLFGEDIPMEVTVPPEEMAEYLRADPF